MILPLFPLHTVLYPNTPLPIHIFEDRYRRMLATSLRENSNFGVVLIKSGEEVGGPAVPHDVGTEARILELRELPGDRYNLLVEGLRRFRIIELVQRQPYLKARVVWLKDASENAEDAHALKGRLVPKVRRYLEYLKLFWQVEVGDWVHSAPPQVYSHIVAYLLQVDLATKQRLLEKLSVEERLREEIEILKLF